MIKNFKSLPISALITLGMTTGYLFASITDHLHLELDHKGIHEKAQREYYESDKERRSREEREYLNSSEYKEYRDYCLSNGLGDPDKSSMIGRDKD